jgi:hypothetical protein
MTSVAQRLPRDPHRRTLLLLGGATILFVIIAVLALWQRSSELSPLGDPTLLFDGVSPNAVAQIRVTSRAGTFHVVRGQGGGWTVREKAGFPADEGQVRSTVLGVVSLQGVERKTANPEWHSQLGLQAPEKGGDGTTITLLDAAGKALAAVVVGKGADVADAMGRGAVYVRKVGEDQTWLARGYLTAKPALADWLSKDITSVGRERIQSVEVTPPTGPAYVASRARKEVPDFAIANMPGGRSLAFESATEAPASALVGFQFEDAQPVANFDFSQPVAQHVTKTFDGLAVTVRIIDKGGAKWATVSAQATATAAQAEAAGINARARNWAFKLPAEKFNVFAAPLESMLQQPTAAAPAAPGVPGAPAAPPPTP